VNRSIVMTVLECWEGGIMAPARARSPRRRQHFRILTLSTLPVRLKKESLPIGKGGVRE
jgi:hypothetical protein